MVMREEEIWPNHVIRQEPEFRAAATVTTVITTTATDATTLTMKYVVTFSPIYFTLFV